MGLMAHFQRKSIEAAQGILRDQATVVDQANVFAGKPNPMLVGLGLGAVMVLIFALTRIVLGVLLLLLIANAIRQPRNLALTTRGLALFRSSFFGGRPRELVSTHAISELTSGEGGTGLGFVQVQLSPGHVWIREKDRKRLLAAGGG